MIYPILGIVLFATIALLSAIHTWDAEDTTADDIYEIEIHDSSESDISIINDNYDYEYIYGGFLVAHISNPSDNDARITSFSIEANDFEFNEIPIVYGFCTFTEKDGLGFHVINNGWGPARNFTIRVSDIPMGELTIECGDILPGEEKDFVCLSLSQLQTELYQNTTVQPTIRYTYDERAGTVVKRRVARIQVVNGSVELPVQIFDYRPSDFFGEGIKKKRKVGIIVDTKGNNYMLTKKVNRIIPPHGGIRLYLCIAPDRSCSMDLKFIFELQSNESATLKKELQDVRFRVPSYNSVYYSYRWYTIQDGEELGLFDIFRPMDKYFPYTGIVPPGEGR